MAVKIRLARSGAKKNPYYHIIAADESARRDGRYLEKIGAYDPVATPKKIEFDDERLAYWIGVGAQPTDTVRGLLAKYKKAAVKA